MIKSTETTTIYTVDLKDVFQALGIPLDPAGDIYVDFLDSTRQISFSNVKAVTEPA